VAGSKVRVVAVSLVAVGAAAGIAFVLATGSLSSRETPRAAAPPENAEAPVLAPAVPPAAPSAAIPKAPPVSPAPAAAAAAAAPAHVRRLDVRALPAEAQLSLDGGRPVQGRLQRDVSDEAAMHTLHVTADGYQEQMISFEAGDPLPSQVTLKRLPDTAAERTAHPRRGGGHAAISTARAPGPTAVPDEPLVPAAAPVAPAAPRRGANNSLILK
jgi:hypothetical protein